MSQFVSLQKALVQQQHLLQVMATGQFGQMEQANKMLMNNGITCMHCTYGIHNPVIYCSVLKHTRAQETPNYCSSILQMLCSYGHSQVLQQVYMQHHPTCSHR